MMNTIKAITNVNINDIYNNVWGDFYNDVWVMGNGEHKSYINILNKYGILGLAIINKDMSFEGGYDNNDLGIAQGMAKALLIRYDSEIDDKRKDEINKINKLKGEFWDKDTDDYVNITMDEFSGWYEYL